jgi:hypothetical protein
MKLGNARFYALEAKRQNLVHSVEDYPTFGVAFAFCFFVYFAIKRPMSSNLYKEVFLSCALGAMTAVPRVAYHRYNYMQEVSVQFKFLQQKFKKNPDQNVPDDEDVLKNFGISKYGQMSENDDIDDINKEDLFSGGD